MRHSTALVRAKVMRTINAITLGRPRFQRKIRRISPVISMLKRPLRYGELNASREDWEDEGICNQVCLRGNKGRGSSATTRLKAAEVKEWRERFLLGQERALGCG